MTDIEPISDLEIEAARRVAFNNLKSNCIEAGHEAAARRTLAWVARADADRHLREHLKLIAATAIPDDSVSREDILLRFAIMRGIAKDALAGIAYGTTRPEKG